MTKIRGIKSGDILEATFDGQIKKAFPELKQTSVLILVSIIGNNFCRGEFLQASILNALKTHGEVTVLIADEVYWNNLRPLGPIEPKQEEQLKKQALGLGDDFLIKNIDNLLIPLGIDNTSFHRKYDGLDINEQIQLINNQAAENGHSFKLVRWANWSAIYSSAEDQIYQAMDTHPKMKSSLTETAMEFARRSKGEAEELLIHRSTHYLKEETTAIIWLAARLGYQFLAYPGDIIAPFKMAKQLFINPEATCDMPEELVIRSEVPLANWLHINFKRSQSKEQILKHSLIEAKTQTQPYAAGSSIFSFFNSPSAHDPISMEQECIITLARRILEVPGETEFKMQVLMRSINSISYQLNQDTHPTSSSIIQ